MKRLLWSLLALVVVGTTASYAQNKTLAVGTATPNDNAALHVESPTNNQGIIIPRLTTAQRSSFTGALTVGDIGLIVFDTDLRALTIWNGTAWDVGLKTGQPIAVSNTAATGIAGVFENTNGTNAVPALAAGHNGQGSAGDFSINNPGSTAPVLNIATNGSGNAISANAPIQATSFSGDGSALTNVTATAVAANSVGTNALLDNEIANADVNANAAIAGTKISPDFGAQNIATTGTVTATSFAGDGSALTGIDEFPVPYGVTQNVASPLVVFNNLNTNFGAAVFQSAGAGAYAIEATSSGLGGILAQSTGTGSAGQFTNNSSAATIQATNVAGPALNASNTGAAGPVAFFNISDPANNANALQISHAGGGNAIFANAPIQATQFVGDGSLLTNLPSGFVLPYSNTQDQADHLFRLTNTNNTNATARFESTGANSFSTEVYGAGISALYAENTGTTGSAGIFNNNANAPALQVSNVGGGNAIFADAPIQATGFIGDGSGLTNIIADSARTNSVTSDAIADLTIENKDILPGAGIFGSKIDPNFGAQAIVTTGSITGGTFNGNGSGLTNLNSDFGSQTVTTTGIMGAAEVAVDNGGSNTGDTDFSLHFGSAVSGEAIGSKRDAGVGQYGLDFYTATTKRMTIANTGEIGIGTTTPTSKLEIRDDAVTDFTPFFKLRNDNGLGQMPIEFNSGGTYRGKVRGDAGGSITYVTNGGDHYFYTGGDFGDGGVERMKITGSSGFIGIGTSTPTEKLEVVGTVKATAFQGDGSLLTGIPTGSTSRTITVSPSMFETEGFLGGVSRIALPTSLVRAISIPENASSTLRTTVPLPSDYSGGTITATINYTSSTTSGDFMLRFYTAGVAVGGDMTGSGATTNPVLPAVAFSYALNSYDYTLTNIDPSARVITIHIDRWGTIDPADTSTDDFLLLGIVLSYTQ